jgi:hypothetical protein
MTPCVTTTTLDLRLIHILQAQLRFPKDDQIVTEDAPSQVRARLSATRDLQERLWRVLQAKWFKQSDIVALRDIAVAIVGAPFGVLCSVPDRAFRLLHQ